MELDIAKYEAVALLEEYYTDAVWPLREFDISRMSCPVDQGDGSVVTRWDVIDLKGKRLIKVNDYYDDSGGGCEIGTALPSETDPADAFMSLYDDISEQTNPHKTFPTAVSVDDLINAIILGSLNSSGYERSLKG